MCDRDEADMVIDVISGMSGVRRAGYCNFTDTTFLCLMCLLMHLGRLIILTGHLISSPVFIAALSVLFSSGVI